MKQRHFAHLPRGKLACRLPRSSLILRSIINCTDGAAMFRARLTALLLVVAAPALTQETKIAISVRDNQFVPAEVPVPAGVKLEFVVRNVQATPAELESTSLHREKVVTAGATVSLFVGPLQPGRYGFFDDFHPATRGVIVVQ